MLGGLPGGGTPAEGGGGAKFGFSLARPRSWSPDGDAGLVGFLGASDGWKGCCRWRGPGQLVVGVGCGRG